jgi:hypothetical protein
MTTIAWDGKSVAADSRKTFGVFPSPSNYSKLIIKGDIVFACTGCMPLFAPLVDWYLAGAVAKDCPRPAFNEIDNDTVLIIFREGRAFRLTVSVPYAEEVHAPIGWGSGGEYAIGAMRAGADTQRAVEIAIECDIQSGGPVEVIDLTFQLPG